MKIIKLEDMVVNGEQIVAVDCRKISVYYWGVIVHMQNKERHVVAQYDDDEQAAQKREEEFVAQLSEMGFEFVKVDNYEFVRADLISAVSCELNYAGDYSVEIGLQNGKTVGHRYSKTRAAAQKYKDEWVAKMEYMGFEFVAVDAYKSVRVDFISAVYVENNRGKFSAMISMQDGDKTGYKNLSTSEEAKSHVAAFVQRLEDKNEAN